MTKNDSMTTLGDIDPGTHGTWDLPSSVHNPDPKGEPIPVTVTVVGRFLGMSTSQKFGHIHAGTVPVEGVRCSACRWSEIRIFRANREDGKAKGRFIVHYVGRSSVPGETDRPHHEEVRTAPEVLECLTRRYEGKAFLTNPAARVLAQASACDDDIRDTFENRAQV